MRCIILIFITFLAHQSLGEFPTKSSVDVLLDQAMQFGEQGKLKKAFDLYQKAYKINPSHIGVVESLAWVYGMRGDREKALKWYRKLGKLYDAETQPSEKAAAVYNTGMLLLELDRHVEALQQFENALKIDKTLREARIKSAQIYFQRGMHEPALVYLKQAIEDDPNDPGAYMYAGDIFNNLKQWGEAVDHYQKAIDLDPNSNNAYAPLFHMGDTLLNMKRFEEAMDAYKRALSLVPGHIMHQVASDALVGLLSVKRELCDWDNFNLLTNDVVTSLKMHIKHQKPSPLSPYQALFVSDQILDVKTLKQISISHATPTIETARMAGQWTGTPLYRQYTSSAGVWQPPELLAETSNSPLIIRVGYISRRFENYPGTQLMLRLFGLHDRTLFKVYAYAHGPDDHSDERKVVQAQSDVFRDVSLLSPRQVASQIVADNIHILIDYDGIHSFNNLDVLSLRPAPIQVTFLGFAGTTGAEGVIDYFIADHVVIPKDSQSAQSGFTEKILYLDSAQYQPQNNFQQISDDGFLTRETLGLDENAFVFACFNRADKYEPDVFGAWMEILRRTSTDSNTDPPAAVDSLLWLYCPIEEAQANLKKEAEAAGVNPKRIVFAETLPKPDHLARHRVADIFLDTFYYGAHTTASDSLWAGLPVLTKLGTKFSSRVAGSLNVAAGMINCKVGSDDNNDDDDISVNVETIQDYIETAVTLALSPKKALTSRLKTCLRNNREGSAGKSKAIFFRPVKYTQQFEKALIHIASQEYDIGLFNGLLYSQSDLDNMKNNNNDDNNNYDNDDDDAVIDLDADADDFDIVLDW